MKKTLALVIVLTTLFGTTLTAYAAPQVMPDGT